ncbi:hypothetical protein A6R68_05787, partial [Neotoma lepida]
LSAESRLLAEAHPVAQATRLPAAPAARSPSSLLRAGGVDESGGAAAGALDANGDYIAVGSSIGMLYLYCRHLNQMRKYNFE